MKICVVPDTQVKPGVPLDHLLYAGKYIASKKPDVVVMIGDWWDMESLCSYDKGKKSFEGRSYKKDVESGNLAMDLFLQPIKAECNRLKVNKQKQWKPRLVFTMGNHEQRIERAIEYDAILEDTIGYQDLNREPAPREVTLENAAPTRQARDVAARARVLRPAANTLLFQRLRQRCRAALPQH